MLGNQASGSAARAASSGSGNNNGDRNESPGRPGPTYASVASSGVRSLSVSEMPRVGHHQSSEISIGNNPTLGIEHLNLSSDIDTDFAIAGSISGITTPSLTSEVTQADSLLTDYPNPSTPIPIPASPTMSATEFAADPNGNNNNSDPVLPVIPAVYAKFSTSVRFIGSIHDLSEPATDTLVAFANKPAQRTMLYNLTTQLYPADSYAYSDYSGMGSWLRRGKGWPTDRQLNGEQNRLALLVDGAFGMAKQILNEDNVEVKVIGQELGGDEEKARKMMIDVMEAYLEAYFRRAEIGKEGIAWRNWELLAGITERKRKAAGVGAGSASGAAN